MPETTISPSDNFQYHEKWLNPKTNRYSGHVYTLDDKPLRGVTSVLGVIAKPNLIQWAADMCAEMFGWKNTKKFTKGECQQFFTETWAKLSKMSPEEIYEYVEQARTAHLRKKDKGADLGTICHKMVEMYANERIFTDKSQKLFNEMRDSGVKVTGKMSFPKITVDMALKKVIEEDGKDVTLTLQEKSDVTEMFNHFKTWAENPEEPVEFLESEKKMYSKVHWIAGTCDLVIRWKGKKMVGDVKTMDTLWDRTPFFQAHGGYRIMLEERGVNDIEGAVIMCIPKSEKVRDSQNTRYPLKPFSVFESYDYDTDKKGFLAALALTQALETYQK